MLSKAKGRVLLTVSSPSSPLRDLRKSCFPLHLFGGVLSTHGPHACWGVLHARLS